MLFYAAICCAESLGIKQAKRLDKLVKKASSVIGVKMDSLGDVVETQ